MKKLLSFLFFALAMNVSAQTFKVGVLAPEGTNWAKSLKKMTEEIEKETAGKVKFRIYFGGTQGDEHDVLRKIRVGQLQGGIFTGKTLGDINGDVRVLEIPFTFNNNREKAFGIMEKMTPFFDKGFEKNKFKNIGFFELGMVYFVSQKNTPNLSSLSGLKIWSWEGDKLVSTMIESMNLVSVPLGLPDVLSSLSTGIIEAAYAPPMGIIALQWNTKIKYVVDFPITYSIGAFLLEEKSWSKVSPENQAKVESISKRYLAEINKVNDKDNQESIEIMKASGVEFIKFPEADIKKGEEIRKIMLEKLTGHLFSKEALDLMNKEM